jgi:hypothetical protein
MSSGHRRACSSTAQAPTKLPVSGFRILDNILG